jgi:hypothetical protein
MAGRSVLVFCLAGVHRFTRGPNPHADTDSDGNADPHADTDSDGNADPHADTDSDGNADPHADTDSDGNADPHADTDSDGNAGPHADADSDGNAGPHADTDSDGNADPHADTDSDGNTHTDSGPDANAHADSNGNTYTHRCCHRKFARRHLSHCGNGGWWSELYLYQLAIRRNVAGCAGRLRQFAWRVHFHGVKLHAWQYGNYHHHLFAGVAEQSDATQIRPANLRERYVVSLYQRNFHE